MARFGLYAYIEGSDNHDVSEALTAALEEYAAGQSIPIRVVNERFDKTPDMLPEDLPDWNLGVNVVFDELTIDTLTDLLAVLESCCTRFDREFALGYVDLDQTWLNEDITFLASGDAPREVAERVFAFLRR